MPYEELINPKPIAIDPHSWPWAKVKAELDKLAKAAPGGISVEDLVVILRDAYSLVEEADADAATSREAAKYGLQ